MGQETNTMTVDNVVNGIEQEKQICVIHLVFPVEDDAQAICVNAAITDAVKGIKGVKREMRLSSGLGNMLNRQG